MQQLPISTTVSQGASIQGVSAALPGDGKGKGALNEFDAAALDGFSSLLASQIRDALALLQPEGIGAGKAGKHLAGKDGEALADAGVIPAATPDANTLAAFVTLPIPLLQSISAQMVEASSTDKIAESGKPIEMASALLPTGAMPQLADQLAVQGEKAAEFAAAGKNLPQSVLQAVPQSAPQGESKGLSSAGLLHELHGSDALPVAIGEESHKLQAQAGIPDQPRMDGMLGVSPLPVQAQQQLPAMAVAPKVGAPEWGGAVGEKVLWMANQSHQVAELHLNPPNLGPLEVRLTVSNDQASAMFVSPHPVVREAIEAALPRLREMLADNGIMLGNATVSQESFGQQQQAFNHQANDGGQGRGDGREDPNFSGLSMERGSVSRQSLLDGMVDTFA